MVSLLCLVAGFLCWQGDQRGYALSISLAGLGIFADFFLFALDILSFYGSGLALPSAVAFGVLQLPLAYFGLRTYGGSLRMPILLIIMGSLLLSSSYISNASRSYFGPAIDISHPQITTLSEILSGRFPSSIDKYGTNGTVVEVVDVTVIQVFGALDGDKHVTVNQTGVKLFITEIVPRDQARLHVPAVGARITIIGVVYWDDAHTDEAWHGYTGWEIHPVLAWSAI